MDDTEEFEPANDEIEAEVEVEDDYQCETKPLEVWRYEAETGSLYAYADLLRACRGEAGESWRDTATDTTEEIIKSVAEGIMVITLTERGVRGMLPGSLG